MKMTTTLLATLLFASTGAIADTTTLTEQDKLLMDRAAILQMSTCMEKNLQRLESDPNTVELIAREYHDAWGRVSQLGLSRTGKNRISTDELTSALVTYCMPKARN
ncbi:hypothetical protein [Vibrio caribbeanicus]|uniref:hypothetical protein n=1 Tax=Vibrio caribbeanicus TaxID=701175 RepID=UPI0030DB301E